MLLFIVYYFVILHGNIQACPSPDVIAPCKCMNFRNSDIMACTHLLNPDDLVKPITAVAESHSSIEVLTIVNSSLLYIPNSVFKNTSFEKIHFMNSDVMSLSDTDIAFEGLENSLSEIRAQQSSYIAQWDWNQLRNLKELQLIDVTDIELGSISIPFPKLDRLKFLGILNAGISLIINYAFANLKNLAVLNLKGNDISELNRNMFPEPAENLISIDLSWNQLSSLPDDIFRNMPSLQHVILDNNKFTTLQGKGFAWAIKNLYELGMFGNKIVCDCKIKWMIGGHVPITYTGVCDSPEILKGKPLRKLQLEELTC